MKTKQRSAITIEVYSGGVEIRMPKEIIENLTQPGKDASIPAARYARRCANVLAELSSETIMDLLIDYGCWTLEEMQKWHRIRLTATLLWVAAGSENGYVGD